MRIALTTVEAALIPAFRQLFYTMRQFPPDRINLMKTTIFALCFLCATAAAFGQTASVQSNNAQPISMPDDVPLRAVQHDMAMESNLLGASAYSYAQGERPMSEFVTLKRETPLGDIARAYRKEHAMAPKAVVVFDK
jgi:hypothetical protein